MSQTMHLHRGDRFGDVPGVDGRTARAIRTREAIVDACIALIDGGDLRPTAPRIADQAAVSVRSVFQHFDDLETLFRAVGARVMERLAALIVPIASDLPLDRRIDALVAQRAAVLEAVTPVRRAASVHSVDSAEINRMFQAGHDFLRDQAGSVFAPELAEAGDGSAMLLDSLDVVLSWSSWETLRLLSGRTPSEARQVQASMLRALLRPARHVP